MKIYYVYVLRDKTTNRLYFDLTSNLKKRLAEHQRSKLTHRNKDFKLIFFEGFVNKKDAQEREKYFKKTKGKRATKLMLKYTLKYTLDS